MTGSLHRGAGLTLSPMFRESESRTQPADLRGGGRRRLSAPLLCLRRLAVLTRGPPPLSPCPGPGDPQDRSRLLALAVKDWP
jgi:hypothetical protein